MFLINGLSSQGGVATKLIIKLIIVLQQLTMRHEECFGVKFLVHMILFLPYFLELLL